jgi:hypothetical protein
VTPVTRSAKGSWRDRREVGAARVPNLLEARMARLQVEVRFGAGVRGYSLFVDGLPATMDSAHRGEAVCAGRCGDGSLHALLYSFNGSPGATLSITLRCAVSIVCRIRAEREGEGGPPWRAGREVFVL